MKHAAAGGDVSSEQHISDGRGLFVSRVPEKLILTSLPDGLVALTEGQTYRGPAPLFQQVCCRPLN